MKAFLRKSALFGVLIAIFMLSMIAVFIPSNDGVAQNVQDSLAILEGEGDPGIVLTYPKVDTWTDTWMIKDALKPEGTNAVQAAMFPDFEIQYWHGWMLAYRPLLHWMNLAGIRYLNMYVFIFLLAVSTILVQKRVGIPVACLYALSLCFGHILIVPLCMQYMSIFVVTMAATAMVCIPPPALRGSPAWTAGDLFLVFGAVACFVDFLTAPLLTLGIPLVVHLLDPRTEPKFLRAFQASVCWAASYLGTWVAKWVIGSLVLHKDVFMIAKAKILWRTVGEMIGQEEPYVIDWRFSIEWNLQEMFSKAAVLVFLALCALLVVAAIFTRKRREDYVKMLPLLAVAALPFLWYIAFAGHSQVHYWMTYRILIVTVFAVTAYLAYGIRCQTSACTGIRRFPAAWRCGGLARGRGPCASARR
jgi:hypothetical protein